MKTSDLIGPAIDWAVAKCEGAMAPTGNVYFVGRQLFIGVGGDLGEHGQWVEYSPSTDPAQAWPIIEWEKITLTWTGENWEGYIRHDEEFFGPTPPLVVAMRCYVASKLGDEVEIPEELK